jgi:hypothetical protein
MQEIQDVFEIKTKRKLLDILKQLQDSEVDQLFLTVDKKGEVYIEYARYHRRPI